MSAKVLTLEEALDWGRERVWIQLRGAGEPVETVYVLEKSPWLRFRNPDTGIEIIVRGSVYGKTWRCFDMEPKGTEGYAWEDGEEWSFPKEEADPDE